MLPHEHRLRRAPRCPRGNRTALAGGDERGAEEGSRLVVWDVDVANRTKADQKAQVIVQIPWSGGDRFIAEVALKAGEKQTVGVKDPISQATNFCNAQPIRVYLAGSEPAVDLTPHDVTPKLSCAVTTHVENPWTTMSTSARESARAGKVIVDDVSVSTTTPACNGKVHWRAHVSSFAAQTVTGRVDVFKTSLGPGFTLAPGKTADLEGDVTYIGGLHDAAMLAGSLPASPTVPVVQAQASCSLTLDVKF